jgi:undecaprenyl-diphosphatase
MEGSRPALLLQWMSEIELPVCLALNRTNRRRWVRALFGTTSRLGNGWFWGATALGILAAKGGWNAAPVLARMAAAVAFCLVVYKTIKSRTRRPRPCTVDEGILRGVPPLDRYSFPSGHTMHAIALTLVAISAYPVLGWILGPFTLLVAASRVVLGLHYPSDVAAGALIGAATALLVLQF